MKKLNTIDKIYIICDKEKEFSRYEKWINWIDQRNDVEIFSYNWSDSITDEDLKYWYVRNEEIEKIESKFRTFPLNLSEISCSLNWVKLLEKAYNENYERILVFESDAYFDEDFEQDFNRAIKLISAFEKNKRIDIVSIGKGGGQNALLGDDFYVSGLFKVNSTRALEALILNRSGIIKILEYINANKIRMVFDIELKYASKEGFLEIYWLEPPIVRQTSVDGLSESFLNQGQFHLLNNEGYNKK